MAYESTGLRRRLSEHYNLGQNVKGDQLKLYIATKKLNLAGDLEGLARAHASIRGDIQRYLQGCRFHWLELETSQETRALEAFARRSLQPELNPL